MQSRKIVLTKRLAILQLHEKRNRAFCHPFKGEGAATNCVTCRAEKCKAILRAQVSKAANIGAKGVTWSGAARRM